MDRKEFLRLCGLMGLAVPIYGKSIIAQPNLLHHTKEKFIVIGAGSAGLTAAYLLNQLGKEVTVLEASESFGGRIKINTVFADFPIPLGAEWIETKLKIFKEIINNPDIRPDIKTFKDDNDRKFYHSSWYNFYEKYVLPEINEKIKYGHIVSAIDYTQEHIKVQTNEGAFEATKVICCVPLKMLQENTIQFNPPLPQKKQNAIQQSKIWAGFKVFIKFSQQFYETGYQHAFLDSEEGQRAYYDAAYGQDSKNHILGLFSVGTPAEKYHQLKKEDVIHHILEELDELFDGKASEFYVDHLIQDWQDEPFIKAAYLTDYAHWQTVSVLGESISDKLYFAGGSFTDGNDWVSVHAAARSSIKVVKNIVESDRR